MWVGVYEWRGGVLKDDKESSSGEQWRAVELFESKKAAQRIECDRQMWEGLCMASW